MSASCNIPSSKTYGLMAVSPSPPFVVVTMDTTYSTFSSYSSDIICLCQSIHIRSLNTRSKLECWPTVCSITVVRIESEIVELVGPNRERSCSHSLVRKVVPSILHIQADVGLSSKIESQLYLGDIRNFEGVCCITSEGAVCGFAPQRRWDAGHALEERPLS